MPSAAPPHPLAPPTEQPQLTVLSLGAGVQSTAVLMLILDGEVHADCAVFADTGWEPKAVYEHLRNIKRMCDAHGFPLYHVAGGNIRDTSAPNNLVPRKQCEWATMPFHVGTPDGEPRGVTTRQCTVRLKIQPVRRQIRLLLAERNIKPTPGVCHQLMGISVDEITRVKQADVQYIRHRYPLIERGWDRATCKQYLADRGINAPRSSCVGCPYHSNAEWRRLRDTEPESFQDAIMFEREVQQRFVTLRKHGYLPFLHRSRKPLDQAILDDTDSQGTLWQGECEGMCGV